jgi:hypothetical protein
LETWKVELAGLAMGRMNIKMQRETPLTLTSLNTEFAGELQPPGVVKLNGAMLRVSVTLPAHRAGTRLKARLSK